MSTEKKRARPADYDLDGGNPEINQAMAELVEQGLIVDSGRRKFQSGKWRIVWVAVPPEEFGKQHIARRKN